MKRLFTSLLVGTLLLISITGNVFAVGGESIEQANAMTFGKVSFNRVTPSTQAITISVIDKDENGMNLAVELCEAYGMLEVNEELKTYAEEFESKQILKNEKASNDLSSVITMNMGVHYQLIFDAQQEDVKAFAEEYFKDSIQEIISMAKHENLDMNFDIDDDVFREYISSFWAYNYPKIPELMEFIDIYENYYNNKKISELAETISSRTYSCFSELTQTDTLGELLSLMPLNIESTSIQNLSNIENNVSNSTVALAAISSYSPGNATLYAQAWAKKTNNTAYPYYADYFGADKTNNNMWSGGSGINYRPWNDCANFVSQCLYAGGAPMSYAGTLLDKTDNRNWIYSSPYPSNSWGAASNFQQHWANRVGVRASWSNAKFGDPFSMDMGGDGIADHTLIITKTLDANGNQHAGDPDYMYYSCHTSDQYNEKNVRYLLNSYTNGKFYVYSITQ